VVHQKNKQGKPKKHLAKPKVESAPKTYGGATFVPALLSEMEWIKDAQKAGMVNPDFIYPGPAYTIAANADAAKRGLQKVTRGYIRKLNEAVYLGDSLGKSYCKFQFNPDVIQRGVQARNDIQYWFNQDAAQMTQPIPGDASFGFVLLFNREAEVNSGKYIGGVGGTLKIGSNWSPPKTGFEEVADAASRLSQRDAVNTEAARWAALAKAHAKMTSAAAGSSFNPAWVTDLGVLVDLMVLDDITGQSISEASVKAIIARNEKATEIQVADAAKEALENTTVEEDKKDTAKSKDFVTEESLSANVGNTAFLISQPVRVVFTEWFMVEGYISSINVTFNKFSAGMIPTQCVVDIQMQALYMGFAKKDTYLTKIGTIVNDKLASGTSSKPSTIQQTTVVDPSIKLTETINRPFLLASNFWGSALPYQKATLQTPYFSDKKFLLGNMLFSRKAEFEIEILLPLNEIRPLLPSVDSYRNTGVTGVLNLQLYWHSHQKDATNRVVGKDDKGTGASDLIPSVGGVLTLSPVPTNLTAPGLSTPSKVWEILELKTVPANGYFRYTGSSDAVWLVFKVTPTERYADLGNLRPFSDERFTLKGDCSLSLSYNTTNLDETINLGKCEFSKDFALSQQVVINNIMWQPALKGK